MPGRIYAEVDTVEEARRIAHAVDELNPWALRAVPVEELPLALCVKKGPTLRPWTWVKVCDRRKLWADYRGDVGIVRTGMNDATSTFSNKIFIR